MVHAGLGTDDPSSSNGSLYRRWIAANAFGELVGLGGTFALAAAALPALGRIDGLTGSLVTFVALIVTGAFEATVLAVLQHRVMRRRFPSIGAALWWRATLFGALVAYGLGYLPSTAVEVAETAGAAPFAEPAPWLMLLLAAALGAVAGTVLSAFQAAALRRRRVARAWSWLPANALAWGVGMPIIFAGMDVAFAVPDLPARIAVIAAFLTLAGAAVGAIHGRTLVRLARAGGPSGASPAAAASCPG